MILNKNQRRLLNRARAHDKFGFFIGTGYGKTILAILFMKKKIPNKVLIITKRIKIVNKEWEQEFEKWGVEPFDYEMTTTQGLTHKDINWVDQFDALILDESHEVKNHKSKAFKILMTGNFKYTTLLSGTLMDMLHKDIYTTMHLLNLLEINEQSQYLGYQTFIHKYCIIGPIYGAGLQVEGPIGNQNVEELRARLSQGAYLELKDTLEPHIIEYDLTHTQKVFIKDKVIEHPRAEGEYIFGDSPGAYTSIIRQMLGGKYDEMWIWSEKITKLKSLISPGMVIFTTYKSEVEVIHRLLLEMGYPECDIKHITGDKKDEHHPQSIVICNVVAAGTGIDSLKMYNKAVYYSLPFSFIKWEQSLGRIDRDKTDEERALIETYVLVSGPEKTIYKALQNKKTCTEALFMKGG